MKDYILSGIAIAITVWALSGFDIVPKRIEAQSAPYSVYQTKGGHCVFITMTSAGHIAIAVADTRGTHEGG